MDAELPLHKHEALARAQATAAQWAAWILVASTALFAVWTLIKPGANGLPSTWALLVALAITLGLAVFTSRGALWVRHALPLHWAVAIPLLVTEPFISQQTALAMIGPAALATLTAGKRTVFGCAVLPLLVITLRAGVHTAYLELEYLAVYAVLILILTLCQRTLRLVVMEAARSSQLFDALTRETNEVVTLSGPGRDGNSATISFISPSVTRVLGYPQNEPEHMKWGELIHPDDVPKIALLSKTVRSNPGTSDTSQFRMRHKDGHFRWMVARATNLLHLPHVRGVLSSFVDVTSLVDEREQVERKLEHEARHDAATGLPNRRMLHEQLELALKMPLESASQSLLFIDIDGFKRVNDSLGHDFGDRLIVAIADRFRAQLPNQAELFRFGGDELCALLEVSDQEAERIAEQLLVAMKKAFKLDERDVFVTASIGIAGLRADHDRPEAVLQEADLAMYRAKEGGRNISVRFDQAMRERADRRHNLEQALRGALDAGQLRVVYQPRVHGSNYLVSGFEALLRFRHPVLGEVGPNEFIPIAEETGLIEPIGRWVLREACLQLRDWRERWPQRDLHMAINLSARQLCGPNNVTQEVAEVLLETGLDPAFVELEITESVLMDRAGRALSRLQELKKLGVKLAIDDFGTGYSSLSYLRDFPVDVVKIDRAFVSRLDQTKEDAAIARLIVALAESLGLDTVAEGVETAAQRDELVAFGCRQLQGFLFARPLEPKDAERFLEGLESRPPVASHTRALTGAKGADEETAEAAAGGRNRS